MTARIDEVLLSVLNQEVTILQSDVVVFGDPDGALLSSSLESVQGTENRVYVASRDFSQAESAQDVSGANADSAVVIAGLNSPLNLQDFFEDSFEGRAHSVVALGRLPKSLAELDYLAYCLSQVKVPTTLVVVGNTKHMTKSQNQVLKKYFEKVYASRGQGKFRCLIAQSSGSTALVSTPYSAAQSEGRFGVGGVFGSAHRDHGGTLLADAVKPYLRQGTRILDLGCGNGQVSLDVLKAQPEITCIATDISADAVVSARMTLNEYISRGIAQVVWDDAAGSIDDASIDAVMLNPPFHEGTRVDASMHEKLVRAAYRVLTPGGELFLVHNSHLRYRGVLEDTFTQVEQLARNSKFTVLRAVKSVKE